MSDLQSFAGQVAPLNLSQPEIGIALIWFKDQEEEGTCVAVADVADTLHRLGLTSKINISRFTRQLAKRSELVRGEFGNTFRLRIGSRPSLDEKYSRWVGRRRVRPTDSIIDRALFTDRRPTWLAIVVEMNGCYDHGFYDGAAVLARRLAETLILEAFKAKNAEAAIKTSKDEFMMMEGLIGVLSSGQQIKLSRSSKPALDPIKTVGDIAAHSPHHITTRKDVDAIAPQLRVLISELLNIIDGK